VASVGADTVSDTVPDVTLITFFAHSHDAVATGLTPNAFARSAHKRDVSFFTNICTSVTVAAFCRALIVNMDIYPAFKRFSRGIISKAS